MQTKSGGQAMNHAVNVGQIRALEAGLDPSTITGNIPAGAQSIKGAPLMDIKKSIMELAKKSDGTISENAMNRLGGAYQSWLRGNFPEYKSVDDLFAAMSKPIDQAKIIEEVTKRGTGAFNDAITPAGLAKALYSKQLPATATKNTSASWKDLTPQQRDTMAGLMRFAKGRDSFANAGRMGGGSDTAQKLAYASILEGAGLPQWLSGGLGAKTGGVSKLLESLYRDAAVNRSGNVLNELLADPKQLAAALKNAPLKPIEIKQLMKQSAIPALLGSNTTQR